MLIYQEDGMIAIMTCIRLGAGCKRHLNGFIQFLKHLAISEWDSILEILMVYCQQSDQESGLNHLDGRKLVHFKCGRQTIKFQASYKSTMDLISSL